MSYVNVATAVGKAYTAYSDGQNLKRQGDLQNSMATYQGGIAIDQANDVAAIIRKAGRKAQGASNAAYAGAGVKVGEGSAAQVEQQIALDSEHDAYQALLEGSRRARAYKVGGALAQNQAGQAATATYINGFSSAIGSAYQGFKSSGWNSNGPGFSGTQAPAPVTDARVG